MKKKYIIILLLLLKTAESLANHLMVGHSISPVENLLREHDVLNRLLTIYEKSQEQTKTLIPFTTDSLRQAAMIMQQYIENFHEILEENAIFPLFEQENIHVDLITELRKQHQVARSMTQSILALLGDKPILRNARKLQQLSQLLQEFIIMYRVHESHEDTELFPLLYEVTTLGNINRLSKLFADTEKNLFGPNGFNNIVQAIVSIEKQLGIYDIDQFTPSV